MIATILIICGVLFGALSFKWNFLQYPAGAAWGALMTLIVQFAQDARESHVRFWDVVKLQTVLRNHRIRLSISGLVRIRNGDDYLLVKSERIDEQFQPVGGALKFHPAARSPLSDWGADFETGYGNDADLINDLRFSVTGKNVIRVLRWFRSSDDRERSPWREFHEELVAPGILPASEFEWLIFRRTRTHVDRLHYAEHFQMNEILIAEIYEPFLSPSQEQSVESLRDQQTDTGQFRWVAPATIRHLGRDPGGASAEIRIGRHSKWIMEGDHGNA